MHSNRNTGAIQSSSFFKPKDLEIELCIKSLKRGQNHGYGPSLSELTIRGNFCILCQTLNVKLA